jgi:2,3-bisphosphoglycerate-independent phosphoglycerate mutase
MLTEEGTPKTSHTVNKVPFVMANAPESWSLKKSDGVLGDVAPTLLATMGLQQPEDMDGHSYDRRFGVCIETNLDGI